MRLARDWEPVQATLSGSDPIARAKAAIDEAYEIRDPGGELINRRLSKQE